jgi:lipid II:glycine glycyltransferase (peptidoglycan interpeptide bridge formation enzyme)
MRFGDRTAAAAIITEACGIVQYHLAATFSDFVKQHPQKLMFHQVGLWAKDRGNRVLHLGGGLGGQEDDLFHFKAGFSPLRHPFHTWRARSDATLYKRVVSLWEKMRPDSVDPVFFPPYRQLHSCA